MYHFQQRKNSSKLKSGVTKIYDIDTDSVKSLTVVKHKTHRFDVTFKVDDELIWHAPNVGIENARARRSQFIMSV